MSNSTADSHSLDGTHYYCNRCGTSCVVDDRQKRALRPDEELRRSPAVRWCIGTCVWPPDFRTDLTTRARLAAHATGELP